MGKQIHLDPAAEKEATEIGMKFMNSTDVVGDMSRTFGTDLSSVRIHTDEGAARRAAERGVDAYSAGKDIFFARGSFDRSDPASRGLLAHELSHSLQQGLGGGMRSMTQSAPAGAEQGGLISWFRKKFSRKKPVLKAEDLVNFSEGEDGQPEVRDFGRFFAENNTDEAKERYIAPKRRNLVRYVGGRLRGLHMDDDLYEDFTNASGTKKIAGISPRRNLATLQGPAGGDLTNEQVFGIYSGLMGGNRYRREHAALPEGADVAPEDAEEAEKLDKKFDIGVMRLKAVQLGQLRRLKEKYGMYGSQMHPEDFISRLGPEWFADTAFLQDCYQMMSEKDGGGSYFDYENNPEDREYKLLADYYNDVFSVMQTYVSAGARAEIGENRIGDFDLGEEDMEAFEEVAPIERMQQMEKQMRKQGAEGFTRSQQRSYEKRVRDRFNKKGQGLRLFGRFA